jgi:hypothetical protein
MAEITVTTQAELDALPASFKEFTYIYIASSKDVWLTINRARENSHVEARENSHVEARENSHVEARENSHVEAWENSHVVAWENSHVEARENSHVEAWENSHVVAWENSHVEARENSHVEARENSHVEAWENSHVEAWKNSHVEARENSHVEARENSHVEAWENSHVEAWENSHVEAWKNSHVEARENSHVVARENSHVVARGNSHVEARGNVCIWNHSTVSEITLFAFSVCFAITKSKIKRKSKFSKVITPRTSKSLAEWGVINGVELSPKVILYKRVSVDFKTQESTNHETTWLIGSTLTHPDWKPKNGECGSGKFHACPKPFLCDQFRSISKDRYIAVEVARKDLYSWPNPEYQNKIAFRKGTVLYECDRYGKRILAND